MTDRTMKSYIVSVPIAGYLTFAVKAENGADAEAAAFDQDWRLDIESSDGVEVGEVEMLKHVTQGNVCYAPMNSIDVEEVEDD